jgi:HlyD family secretion protein
MEQLFRQDVMDRLNSPERLDELLRITSPRGWIALLSLALVILTALAWGIYGTISTKVEGSGIFIDPEGVHPVISLGSGRLSSIRVKVGDIVEVGQLVATMTNPDVQKQLDNQKIMLSALETEYAQEKNLMEKESESKRRVLGAQRDNITSSIKIQDSKAKWLKDRLSAYEDLFSEGYVLKQNVVQTRLDLDNTMLESEKLQNELGNNHLQEVELQESLQQRIFKQKFDIAQAKGKVELVERQLEESTQVFSPIKGTVISLEAMEESMIQTGMTILNVEPLEPGLKVFMSVSAMKGKKIQPGMTAEITPTTVKREEYGYIFGTVIDISEFPITADSLMRLFNNRSFVEDAIRLGPLTSVNIEPVKDTTTRSGFKWSSQKGARVLVTVGTLCSGEVVVKLQSPISLVIPKLKEWIGQ